MECRGSECISTVLRISMRGLELAIEWRDDLDHSQQIPPKTSRTGRACRSYRMIMRPLVPYSRIN